MRRAVCPSCGAVYQREAGATHCADPTASRSWQQGSTRAWRGLRAQALLRDGHTCQGCGTVHGLQVHHRVELHHGGQDTLANLITLCSTCHGRAHGPAAA